MDLSKLKRKELQKFIEALKPSSDDEVMTNNEIITLLQDKYDNITKIEMKEHIECSKRVGKYYHLKLSSIGNKEHIYDKLIHIIDIDNYFYKCESITYYGGSSIETYNTEELAFHLFSDEPNVTEITKTEFSSVMNAFQVLTKMIVTK